jgi:hypothetical protein
LSLAVVAQTTDKGTAVSGRYTNREYGFSVTVPKRLKAFRNSPPAPNHGFRINLSEQSYLWVDASYNVTNSTYDTIPQREVAFLNQRGANQSKLSRQAQTMLRGIPAIHFRIDYELNGVPMVAERIWALRTATANAAGIEYSINLECAKNRFVQDSRIVEALRRAWHLDQIE